MRASNGSGVPRTASRLIAAAACAVRHSTHASCTWSAAPSSPSPTRASARWASGARSPEAPTLPWAGTRGCTRAFNIATMSSGRRGRTPLVPRTSTLARSSIMARTASMASGSPTPEAWLRIRLSCSWRMRSAGMRTWASLPNPVVTPYMVAPRARAASTTSRLRATSRSAPAGIVTVAPSRATATTSAIESDRPSMVTGARIRGGNYEGARWPQPRATGRLPGASCRLVRRDDDRARRLRREHATPQLELRVAGIGLHAPIEHDVLPAHVRDAQGTVVERGAVHDLEHVAEADLGLRRVRAIAARRGEVDRRQIGHGAVHLHLRARVHGDDPNGRVAVVPIDDEIDVAAGAALDEPQLARIPDTVVVHVVPEPEPRRGRIRAEREHEHVARVGTGGILPPRRPLALGTVGADGRHAVAARHTVREGAREELRPDRRPLEVPGRSAHTEVEIVTRAVHLVPVEPRPPGRSGVVRPEQIDRLVQRHRLEVGGRGERIERNRRIGVAGDGEQRDDTQDGTERHAHEEPRE